MGRTGAEASWGRATLDLQQVQAFAQGIKVSAAEQEIVARTLHEFPVDVLSRGMYFQGLVNVLRSARGNDFAQSAMNETNTPKSTVAFSLYPHRDFYKLFFYAAPAVHPGIPMASAMERIAETFYPVFRESMVGRTIALLMGSEPYGILERLCDAYAVSVNGNRHTVERAGPQHAIWHATVEPTAVYPSIFRGILVGAMRSHSAAIPRISPVSEKRKGDRTEWSFDVHW